MSSTMVWSRAESVLDVVIFSLSVTGIGWRFDVRAEGGPVGSALAVHLRRSAALLPSTMSIMMRFERSTMRVAYRVEWLCLPAGGVEFFV